MTEQAISPSVTTQAGDQEASAHHWRFGKKLPSSRTCCGICY
jgi:hypothetical protein